MINESRYQSVCSLETNASCWNAEVHRLNLEFSDVMSSVVILMVALMVVGFIGNTIVLAVYRHRQNRTTAQIFIMYLAGTDLLACIVIHPYVIYKLFNNYSQTWTAVCKMFEFTIHASLTISGVALLAIATDRYLAICRPIKFLDFHKHIYKIILATFAFGTFGSTPLLLFYGSRSEEMRVDNHIFVGYKCDYTENYRGSAMVGYSVFVVSGFLLEIAGMVILYKNVAVVAFRSRRRVNPVPVKPGDIMPMMTVAIVSSKTSALGSNSWKAWTLNANISKTSSLDACSPKTSTLDPSSSKMSNLVTSSLNTFVPGTCSSKTSTHNISSSKTFAQEPFTKISKLSLSTQINSVSSNELSESRLKLLDVSKQPCASKQAIENSKLPISIENIKELPQSIPQSMSPIITAMKSPLIQRLNRTKNLSSGLKAAKILFLVTAVFLLSWLPFFTLRLMYTVGILSPVGRSQFREVLEHFLNHCFYVNNAANPLIYSVINANFRQECRKLLKRLCGWMDG